MSLWATKRRLAYGGTIVAIFVAVVLYFSFNLFYKRPTCNDGLKNGDEAGTDCGGSCTKLCTSDALNPVILWAKTFNVSGDLYTATAYVQNPNISSVNKKAEYTFTIYDENNDVITIKDGVTSIPKGKKFAVFETGIVMRNQKPKYTNFKFTKFATWEKDSAPEPNITIDHGSLIATTSSPRVEGKVTNRDLTATPNLELDVFVLDSKENVVAVGRTFLDSVGPKGAQDFVFTWPKVFNLGIQQCTTPVDLVIAIDKSVSMQSEGISPSEPLETLKGDTIDFVSSLNDVDKVGVVSFNDFSAVSNSLSLNKDLVVSSIQNIKISSTSPFLGLADALTQSFLMFGSADSRPESKKSVVLVTGGDTVGTKKLLFSDSFIATVQSASQSLIGAGASVYIIGLGNNINSDFLKSIASSNNKFFSAPKKNDLPDAFNQILSTICQKNPSEVNVIFRTI